MPLKLSDDVKALVRGANFAHLATLMADGSPQVAPVWVDLDGDLILVSTGEGSLKAKNTRRDARVGLSIVAMDNPYREAQIRGRIVERRSDADFKTMDRISRKYTGKPFPFRDNPAQRVVLAIDKSRSEALSIGREHDDLHRRPVTFVRLQYGAVTQAHKASGTVT